MRETLKFTLCGALAVALSLSVFAEQSQAKKKKFQWEEITQADWDVKEDTTQDIRDAVVIFEKSSMDDRNLMDKKYYYVLYRRIRILSSEGRSWADVSVPAFFEKQKVESIQGRVVLRNGEIVEFDPENVFEKEILKSKFGKIKQKSLSLTGVTDDCILEYRYKIKMSGHISRWLVQGEIASLYSEFSWKFFYGKGISNSVFNSLANDYAPNYMWFNTSRKPKVKRLPSLKEPVELVFSIDSVLPLKSEPWSLPDVTRQAQLRIYYGSGGSSEAYWGEQATSIQTWQRDFCKKNKRTKKLAEKFDKLQTEQEKIAEAYHWLQTNLANITYDEPEKKPKKNKSSADVMKRGYATSLHINFVFCDLLQEMNIDARMVFVVDRDENLLVRDIKEWQFDRGIVAVPVDDGFEYYSPGTKYLPITHVPWFNEGIDALIGLGATGEAARSGNFRGIPFSNSNENKISRSITASLADDFHVSAICQERRTGHTARHVRFYFDEKPASDQPEGLRDEIKDLFPDAEIDSISAGARDSAHLPLTLSYRVDFEAPLQAAGKRLFLMPSAFLESTDNPFDAAERESAIMFDYAQETIEALSVSVPPGWDIEALPSDTVVFNKIGSCALSFNQVGGALAVQRRFVLNSPYWPVEDYRAVQELFAGREALNGLTVVLKKSATETGNDG